MLNKVIKVLLVEDQALVRGALSALLNLEPDIEVVAEASNGREALKLLDQHCVDIVLSDIEMPEMTGIELAEHIQKHQPNIKTAIVTTFGREGYIRRAIEAGVSAFLLKDTPSEKLAKAMRQAMLGKTTINPELALASLSELDPLTNKERKALRLAFEGLSTTEIASKLFLSDGTVRNYLSEAISKLNATNRVDAARIAHQKGWL